MARAKNKKRAPKKAKTKTKAKTRARSKPKTKGRAKSKAKARAGKSKARGAKKGAKSAGKKSDVERRWREYWSCRTDLEKAVAAVEDADGSLKAARELERACRAKFDATKDALKGLLEVEPAAGGGSPSAMLAFPPSGGEGDDDHGSYGG